MEEGRGYQVRATVPMLSGSHEHSWKIARSGDSMNFSGCEGQDLLETSCYFS